ncbi:MAG: hypothetical protein BGO49_31330 [Planctomycetales bacterium 71-10]|nr:MAG: hypothetical protein BGO49_31330 [Planctomycetales bacterium 71-10]
MKNGPETPSRASTSSASASKVGGPNSSTSPPSWTGWTTPASMSDANSNSTSCAVFADGVRIACIAGRTRRLIWRCSSKTASSLNASAMR